MDDTSQIPERPGVLVTDYGLYGLYGEERVIRVFYEDGTYTTNLILQSSHPSRWWTIVDGALKWKSKNSGDWQSWTDEVVGGELAQKLEAAIAINKMIEE
jgi:hypothetical protein